MTKTDAETCGCCERELGTIDYDTGVCECGALVGWSP